MKDGEIPHLSESEIAVLRLLGAQRNAPGVVDIRVPRVVAFRGMSQGYGRIQYHGRRATITYDDLFEYEESARPEAEPETLEEIQRMAAQDPHTADRLWALVEQEALRQAEAQKGCPLEDQLEFLRRWGLADAHILAHLRDE